MIAVTGAQKLCLDEALRALCASASRREQGSLTSEAMRIEGECGHAGFASGELPDFMVDGEVDLDGEGGKVGGGETQEPAQRGVKRVVEGVEQMVRRAFGGDEPGAAG